MYLSEEKRAAIRGCMGKHHYNFKINGKQKKSIPVKGCHDTEDVRKISQILFDARDGKEIFTPF